ncbi:Uncharacterized protein DAT39_010860 [Clarias magur]|uniref:Uncharacterized protein n=1 Tax=Clarias magur TaxID=1594786 RepID=A0A8J4U473_CLAMG|nr:Uncharacterized protein DAT39_010860 [Clarias magur]
MWHKECQKSSKKKGGVGAVLVVDALGCHGQPTPAKTCKGSSVAMESTCPRPCG